MLAEMVDAVVGVDTHRDVHEAELAAPNGSLLAQLQVANDSAGFAQLLAWIVGHAPGPRVVVAVEGTRSCGIGLTRALTAAGSAGFRRSRREMQARVIRTITPGPHRDGLRGLAARGVVTQRRRVQQEELWIGR
jgi:transposase